MLYSQHGRHPPESAGRELPCGPPLATLRRAIAYTEKCGSGGGPTAGAPASRAGHSTAWRSQSKTSRHLGTNTRALTSTRTCIRTRTRARGHARLHPRPHRPVHRSATRAPRRPSPLRSALVARGLSLSSALPPTPSSPRSDRCARRSLGRRLRHCTARATRAGDEARRQEGEVGGVAAAETGAPAPAGAPEMCAGRRTSQRSGGCWCSRCSRRRCRGRP